MVCDPAAVSLSLPNAVKEELTLDQHGTDLVINLRGQRRVLALPDALAALDIAGATLADGHLTVRFA